MAGTILVKRRGYRRKDGTRVKATTFRIEDRGRKGRGPKVVGVGQGGLGGPGYAARKQGSRRRILASVVRDEGYATAVRRLNALRVLGKRTMSPSVRRRLKADMDWLRRRHSR